jgi:hypothetical protein
VTYSLRRGGLLGLWCGLGLGGGLGLCCLGFGSSLRLGGSCLLGRGGGLFWLGGGGLLLSLGGSRLGLLLGELGSTGASC